jgi:hypothetical protein
MCGYRGQFFDWNNSSGARGLFDIGHRAVRLHDFVVDFLESL